MRNNFIIKEHYLWQRRIIGFMILFLTPLSFLFGLIGWDTNPAGWWYSISDTFYSNSAVLMIGVVSIGSFFFCSYKGYDIRDKIVNLITGIGFLCIVIFPCGNEGVKELGAKVGLFQLPIDISATIHKISAAISFVGMFVNVMFLFTLNKGEISKQKKKRNIVYRVCAILILIGILIIAASPFLPKEYIPKNLVWWAEFIILVPTGIAWVVKSEALEFLNDK